MSNRSFCIITLFSGVFFLSKVAFSEEAPVNKITCPSKIECLKDGNASSCKLIGTNLQYWGNILEGGRISKGTYTFSSVQSSYQRPDSIGISTICTYINSNSVPAKKIDLFAAKGAALEVSDEYLSNWSFNGYFSKCSGASASCVLDIIPAVYFNIDSELQNQIELSVNNFPVQMSIDSGHFGLRRIMDEDVKSLCPCSLKHCKIKISLFDQEIGADLNLGQIEVDATKRMKILNIYSNLSSGYEINRFKGLNVINIQRIEISKN